MTTTFYYATPDIESYDTGRAELHDGQWFQIFEDGDGELFGVLISNNPAPIFSDPENSGSVTQAGPVYQYILIWAEESAALAANATEWAYGNGDETPATSGIVLPFDAELFAISVNPEGGNASVSALRDGVIVATSEVISSPSGFTKFSTPVAYAAGQVANFRTATAAGTSSGRACAAFRRNLGDILVAKGDPGAPGLDGAAGVPGQFASIELTPIANVNGSSVSAEFGVIEQGNISGMTVNATSIDLAEGTYRIDAHGDLSTTVQRSNIGSTMTCAGRSRSRQGQNYIRSSNGNNSGSVDPSAMFIVPPGGDAFTLAFNQTGAAGTVAFDGGWVDIQKIA